MPETTPQALAVTHALCFETPRPWPGPEIAGLLSMPGVFLVGADDGFAIGRVAADEAELLTLAVHPRRRRRGHACRLLAMFEGRARADGAMRAHLEVAETNGAARALYAAAGWRESGRRPRYFRTPEGLAVDAVLMSKSLI